MKYRDSYGYTHNVPLVAVPVAFTFVGAAIFLPMAAIRDHTVSQSRLHHEQTITRNAFWEALASDDGAPLAGYPVDIRTFAATVKGLASSPNPAHQLATYALSPADVQTFKHVNHELGTYAIYDPCSDQRSCGPANPETLDAAFSLDVLQATPRYVKGLENPVPAVKSFGLLSWRNSFFAWGGLVAVTFFLTLFGGLLRTMEEAAQRRRTRRASERAERERAASEKQAELERVQRMGPREREAYFLRKKIETWPDTPERTAALKKADRALRIIRSGEASAATRDKAVDIMRELDEVVAESEAWQAAGKSWGA